MGNTVDHGFRDSQPTGPRTVEFPVCHGQGSAAGEMFAPISPEEALSACGGANLQLDSWQNLHVSTIELGYVMLAKNRALTDLEARPTMVDPHLGRDFRRDGKRRRRRGRADRNNYRQVNSKNLRRFRPTEIFDKRRKSAKRPLREAHMRTNHISNSMKSDSSVSPKISVSWKQ